MGLDQYLYVEKYISNWDHSPDSVKKSFKNILEQAQIKNVKSTHLMVKVQILYWRKANAIHKWFVDTVQKGKDECQYSYVDPSDLKQLLDICKQVIEKPDKAPTLLPTTSGFFFGDTSYNQWYFEDLKYTVENLEKVLANPTLKNQSIYYHSSW